MPRIRYPGQRVWVKRRGPRPAFAMFALLLCALSAFIALTRPGVPLAPLQPTEPINFDTAMPDDDVRVTHDIAFDPVELYIVGLFLSDQADWARIEAARFVRRGAAGYVYPADGRYAVLGSGYFSKEDAEAVVKNLFEQEQIEATVLPLCAGNVYLRVTAMQHQLTALTQADFTVRTVCNALQSHALSLDKGAREPIQIRSALQDLCGRVQSALQALENAAGEQPNAVAGGLIDVLGGLLESVERLATDSADTPLTFSGKIKHAFLGANIAHIEFLQSLASP